MDELENRLRGITLAEPPLGFDPDEIATTAARRTRNRRAIASTGVATLAVIAAAVVFVAPGEEPAGIAPVADAATRAEQKARDLQHLKKVLPDVLVGAKDIQAGDFDQVNDWDLVTSEVRYTDAAGTKRQINLTISGPVTTKNAYVRDRVCKPETGRQPMRCLEFISSSGIPVVISEGSNRVSGPAGEPTSRHAIAWPPGGGSVNVSDLGADDAPDAGPSLTDEQLIRLVTDPAFTFR